MGQHGMRNYCKTCNPNDATVVLAASYNEGVFMFLLRSLAIRQQMSVDQGPLQQPPAKNLTLISLSLRLESQCPISVWVVLYVFLLCESQETQYTETSKSKQQLP